MGAKPIELLPDRLALLIRHPQAIALQIACAIFAKRALAHLEAVLPKRPHHRAIARTLLHHRERPVLAEGAPRARSNALFGIAVVLNATRREVPKDAPLALAIALAIDPLTLQLRLGLIEVARLQRVRLALFGGEGDLLDRLRMHA